MLSEFRKYDLLGPLGSVRGEVGWDLDHREELCSCPVHVLGKRFVLFRTNLRNNIGEINYHFNAF